MRVVMRNAGFTFCLLLGGVGVLAGCSSGTNSPDVGVHASSATDAGNRADSGGETDSGGTAPLDAGVDSGPADAAAPLSTVDASPEAGGNAGGFACSPNGTGCTCLESSTGSSPTGTCPAPSMPNPVCCESSGYPKTGGSTCTCENWACSTVGVDCMCAIDSTGTATESSCASSYKYCCEDILSDGTVNSCTCGPFACQAGHKQVASCSISEITCVGGETRVPSCR